MKERNCGDEADIKLHLCIRSIGSIIEYFSLSKGYHDGEGGVRRG